ncbi:hypothetical protein CAC42_962 [Sphaceloma murrayae]|uniref:Uncharacterized protein n=1 Tax=Sphaceloma murrayae TaxID=2082308 RepID=A0A2K1R342_9PEZI|nr:hypothetical protein CAC42_962 [Sphaceloma murrayae]
MKPSTKVTTPQAPSSSSSSSFLGKIPSTLKKMASSRSLKSATSHSENDPPRTPDWIPMRALTKTSPPGSKDKPLPALPPQSLSLDDLTSSTRDSIDMFNYQKVLAYRHSKGKTPAKLTPAPNPSGGQYSSTLRTPPSYGQDPTRRPLSPSPLSFSRPRPRGDVRGEAWWTPSRSGRKQGDVTPGEGGKTLAEESSGEERGRLGGDLAGHGAEDVRALREWCVRAKGVAEREGEAGRKRVMERAVRMVEWAAGQWEGQ